MLSVVNFSNGVLQGYIIAHAFHAFFISVLSLRIGVDSVLMLVCLLVVPIPSCNINGYLRKQNPLLMFCIVGEDPGGTSGAHTFIVRYGTASCK